MLNGLAVVLKLVTADYCPNYVSSRIQECVAPVADYAKIINRNEGRRSGTDEIAAPFSLPNMGGTVFNDLCKLIAKFNECVREQRIKCPRHVTISLIDSSYGYLCNEGYNTFMESADCLMDLDRRPKVKMCHDETLREIETANSQVDIAIDAKMDRMCGALNFFSGCVRPHIRERCGKSAWQVIFRVLKDTTNTLMPACQFTGTSPKLQLLNKVQEETSPAQEVSNDISSDDAKALSSISSPKSSSTSTNLPSTSTTPTINSSESTKKTMRKNIMNSELKQSNTNSFRTLYSVFFVISITYFIV
ncbi:unnamed protein product [Auanema sp. JU1783]|nr:unnamed protein product [Auanema sp. JU1783]